MRNNNLCLIKLMPFLFVIIQNIIIMNGNLCNTQHDCDGLNQTSLSEHNEIYNILNNICSITIDNEFTIVNNGVCHKLGNDSKIISKIYEIVVIDKLKKLLETASYKYIENDVQNKYPDFIIVSKTQNNKYYAVDIKSSYIKTNSEINGFTLGTYNGYFRKRDNTNGIVKPYNDFIKHYCVCIIYSRTGTQTPVKHIIVREKWQIAKNITGSGNTCNIGSIKLLSDLLCGKPYFTDENEFNTYWLSYNC